jgi:predicted RNA-binding Zn-ribbon protein involved in translation (DUF1610 family)
MKTLVTGIFLSVLSLTAFAQTSTTTKTTKTTTTTTTKTTVAYRCPVCGTTVDKAGECPKDKVTYVKVGDYYCPDCYMSQAKPGKCSMCGVDMKKMETASATPATKK